MYFDKNVHIDGAIEVPFSHPFIFVCGVHPKTDPMKGAITGQVTDSFVSVCA